MTVMQADLFSGTEAMELADDLLRRGVALYLGPGGELRYSARPGAMLPELRVCVRERREDLAQHCRRVEKAYAIFEQAVNDIGERWNDRYAVQADAPWADDERLTETIGHAIRRGDVERTAELTEQWRREWFAATARGK